jgi:hypothetical protein
LPLVWALPLMVAMRVLLMLAAPSMAAERRR